MTVDARPGVPSRPHAGTIGARDPTGAHRRRRRKLARSCTGHGTPKPLVEATLVPLLLPLLKQLRLQHRVPAAHEEPPGVEPHDVVLRQLLKPLCPSRRRKGEGTPIVIWLQLREVWDDATAQAVPPQAQVLTRIVKDIRPASPTE